jgi:hypothetical protein
MKIIITENQKNSLLTESVSDKISKSYKSMKKFTEDVLKESTKVTGLDFGFLLSWGATIGGLMMPIEQFIKGEYPELTNTELSLLITGVMVTYYSSNKKVLAELLKQIKEKKLIDVFDEMLGTAENLKNTFLSFVESLNVTISKLSNMMAYTFLIPILPQLYEMAQSGYDQNIINQIIKRLISYGVIIGSSVVVRELIKKIVDRFKN